MCAGFSFKTGTHELVSQSSYYILPGYLQSLRVIPVSSEASPHLHGQMHVNPPPVYAGLSLLQLNLHNSPGRAQVYETEGLGAMNCAALDLRW